MAKLTGRNIYPGDITTVYSRTAMGEGTRAVDDEGNEYIFLNGVASCAAGSWVTYDENYKTTLLASAAYGPVAVAKAAVVAEKCGWFQIWGGLIGKVSNADEGTMADNSAAFGRSSADGTVGVNPTAGDIIYAAICRSAMEASSPNTTTKFQIYYPYVDSQTEAH